MSSTNKMTYESISEVLTAYREGRCVILPKTSDTDRKGAADFLSDCVTDAVYDPSVGLYGLTDGESAIINAVLSVLKD